MGLLNKSSTEIPTPADVPEYAAAVAKLNELQGRRNQLADVLARSREALSKSSPRLNEAALAFLADGELPDKGELRTDLDQAGYELAILDKAIVLQTGIVEESRREANRKIAHSLTPLHKGIARKLRDALSLLVAAMKEERQFHYELERARIDNALPQIYFHVYGATPTQTQELAENWLKEHKDYLR